MNLQKILYRFVLIVFLCTGIVSMLHADDKSNPTDSVSVSDISYWYRNYEAEHTRLLLELALEKTDHLYEAKTVVSSGQLTQGRALALLKSENEDQLDIVNFVPDDERIADLRPIYIAGDEGLVGKRVCLIRRGEEARFKGLRTVEDFRRAGLTFGQGAHWPDTKILRDNGFDVVTNVNFEQLFLMLQKGRFDCFLRGVHEVLDDIEKHGHESLVLEPDLLFAYPSASLFFVSKSDTELASRVELGLRRAILDRSYHKLFDDNYSEVIKAVSLENRRTIRLNNSLLSDEVILRSTNRLIDIDGKIDN